VAALKAEIRRLNKLLAMGGPTAADAMRGGTADTQSGQPGSAASPPAAYGGACYSPAPRTGGSSIDVDVEVQQQVSQQLQAQLEKHRAAGATASAAVSKGLDLARELAQTNGKLREAFDQLSESKEVRALAMCRTPRMAHA
jgi:hypothetical protein